MPQSKTATTGIPELDTILRSLWIGDNVVWEVEAGTCEDVFVEHFVKATLEEGHPLVYFSFNHSPATMAKMFGQLASNKKFTLYDCFTAGKGHNDPTFKKFYKARGGSPSNFVYIEKPGDAELFLRELNRIEEEKGRRTRYVFDSLTGMQDLWGDENTTYKLFTHSCPRLYDLDTIAYWVLEKDAHSAAFRANIKHVTQVALELISSDSMLYLKANKVEGRFSRSLYKPRLYEVEDGVIRFGETERSRKLDIGTKLRNLREQRGMTQRGFADRVGVTASFVSQVERNQISPSIASLMHMAAELNVDPSYFFLDARGDLIDKALITPQARKPYFPPGVRSTGSSVWALTAEVSGRRMDAFLVELPPGAESSAPLFYHKGEEFIMVLSGNVQIHFPSRTLEAAEGDTLYIDQSAPTGWKNAGKAACQLLWVLSPSRL